MNFLKAYSVKRVNDNDSFTKGKAFILLNFVDDLTLI